MIVKVKSTPTNEELMSILRQKLSGEYSVREFGLGKKTVIIKKSTLVGAQITVRENEISVHESTPSIVGGILSSLAMIEWAGLLIYLFGIADAVPAKSQSFEKEVASMIKKQYN